jgi:DNA replication protein DnaC
MKRLTYKRQEQIITPSIAPAPVEQPAETAVVEQDMTEQSLCRRCGRLIFYNLNEAVRTLRGLGINLRPNLCEKCDGDNQARKRAAEQKRHQEHMAEWWANACPLSMHDTKLSRLPCQESSQQVLAWKMGDRSMVLHGHPRKGKTRTVWELFRRLATEGRTLAAYTGDQWAKQFIKRLEKSGSTAYGWVEFLAGVDVLFIDDLDKMHPTPRTEAELFALLRARLDAGKPTFITTNMVGDELAARFSGEYGYALVARLREDFEQVAFS